MKNIRQAEILKIISENNVDTQEQLLAMLSDRGFNATQATISRDIKELKLVKELYDGKYRYIANQARRKDGDKDRLHVIFREGVLSIAVAQNIVVLKTMPGMASAACLAVDNLEIDGVVGTLAGDDTAIIIMKDNDEANKFNLQIRPLLDS